MTVELETERLLMRPWRVEEAAVQRLALERTDRVIVVADGSKVGSATPIVVADANAAMTLVTDPSAPADELGALHAVGIEVVIAERAAPARADSAPARTEAKRPTTIAAGAG